MKKLFFIIGIIILCLCYFRLTFGNDNYFGFNELLLTLQNFKFDFDTTIHFYEYYSPYLENFINNFSGCTNFSLESFLTDGLISIGTIISLPLHFVLELLDNIIRFIGLLIQIIGGIPA